MEVWRKRTSDTDVWFLICEYLTPPDWCQLHATSNCFRELLDNWFTLQDERITIGTRSTAWNAKHRVYRFWLAQRYCEQHLQQQIRMQPSLLVQRRQQQEHREHHPRRRQQQEEEDDDDDERDEDERGTANEELTNQDVPIPIPVATICTRDRLMGFLEQEYFVHIGRREDNDGSESLRFSTLWCGFLPVTCHSLRLDPIQAEIDTSNKRPDPWKEWKDLLDLVATRHDHGSLKNKKAEWERQWKLSTQEFCGRFSILVASMEYWMSFRYSPPVYNSSQRLPKTIICVVPRHHASATSRRSMMSSLSQLVVHVEDPKHSRDTYHVLQEEIQALQAARSFMMDEPRVPCIHLWIQKGARTTTRGSTRTTTTGILNHPSPTILRRPCHFLEMRLDLCQEI